MQALALPVRLPIAQEVDSEDPPADPIEQVNSNVYYDLNEAYSYVDHMIHTLNEISQRLNIEPVSPPERSYLGSPLSSLSPTDSILHILKEGTPPRSPSRSHSPHLPSSP